MVDKDPWPPHAFLGHISVLEERLKKSRDVLTLIWL